MEGSSSETRAIVRVGALVATLVKAITDTVSQLGV